MKILFASDLHGSEFFCQKLVDIFIAEKADKLILLGDLLYHGPRNPLPKSYNPQGVFSLLNTLKNDIIAIRGNCDSEVDQMVLDFPIMSDYSLFNIDNICMFLTHGHIYNKQNLPNMNENCVLIHGHTHINLIEKLETGYLINLGSICMPKQNEPNTYMVYENNLFEMKDLYGNTIKSMRI